MKKRKIDKDVKGTKRINRSVGGDIVIFLFLAITGIIMVFPMYLAIINSLKPMEEMFVFPPHLYVINPSLDNFNDMFKLLGNLWVPFSRYIFNSVFVTIVVTVTHLFFASTAAFVLAKCKFPGSKLINKIVVLSLLFTSSATYIMQYMVMAKLGMINTYWALILPHISTTMGLFLMRQSMSTISDFMIEAAEVDGAGKFRTCWTIVIPNMKPALMTMLIFAFQGAWGIQGGALVYTEALKTLPTVLQQTGASGIARAGVIAASSVLTMMPPLIVFFLAQSKVMETMAHSGIKD